MLALVRAPDRFARSGGSTGLESGGIDDWSDTDAMGAAMSAIPSDPQRCGAHPVEGPGLSLWGLDSPRAGPAGWLTTGGDQSRSQVVPGGSSSLEITLLTPRTRTPVRIQGERGLRLAPDVTTRGSPVGGGPAGRHDRLGRTSSEPLSCRPSVSGGPSADRVVAVPVQLPRPRAPHLRVSIRCGWAGVRVGDLYPPPWLASITRR